MVSLLYPNKPNFCIYGNMRDVSPPTPQPLSLLVVNELSDVKVDGHVCPQLSMLECSALFSPQGSMASIHQHA